MKYRYPPYIAASLIIVLFCSLFINPAYSFNVYFWSLFSLVFVLSIGLRVIVLHRIEDILFIIVLFLTWLNFLEPYLQSEKVFHLYRTIPEQYLESMSFFAAMSIIALLIGYYFSFKKKKVKPFFKEDLKFSSNTLSNILLLLIVIYAVYRFFKIFYPELIAPFIGVLSLLDYFTGLISAALTLILLRKNGNIIIIIVAIVFLIIQFLIALAQTLFVYVALIVVTPLLIYYFERNKVPLIVILITAILISPLYMVRHYYRKDAVAWWYEGSKASSSFLIEQGTKILEETYLDGDIFDVSDKIVDADKHAKSRLESISYLGQCVYQHKIKNRPYLLGETFWWLPLVPIPRAIFPFKPENLMSTKMAEEYGLKGHTKGSMNWPMLAEHYVNFGFLGMVIMSFFQGLAYRFIYSKIAYGKGDLNLIALFSMLLPITRIEGNITLVFGQVMQFMIIWYILSITILKKFRYKKYE